MAGPNLSLVYDSISLPESAKPALASITSPSGGLYAAIVPVPPELSPSPNIKIIQTGAMEAFNTPEIGKKAYKLLEGTLQKGIFKPNPVLLFENGLNDVDKGFRLGREGKVRFSFILTLTLYSDDIFVFFFSVNVDIRSKTSISYRRYEILNTINQFLLLFIKHTRGNSVKIFRIIIE